MRPALPELAGFYVDSVLYARDFAAAMSAEAAVAYLVTVLASCGYRYIHIIDDFRDLGKHGATLTGV